MILALLLAVVAAVAFATGWLACSAYMDSFQRRGGMVDLTGRRPARKKMSTTELWWRTRRGGDLRPAFKDEERP